MVYKHVIGLKTDSSQSNLGGNTDSNHLIPGVVGHFPSVSLRRQPVQLVILISFFFSPASDAGVLPPLWRGRVLPFTVQSRDHLATITDIYVPSFLRSVPRGIPRFSFFCSPALNAGFSLCIFRASLREPPPLGVLCARVLRARPLLPFVHSAVLW